MSDSFQNNSGKSKDVSEPPITGHVYDGIEEYDNPLPNWWLITFCLTIIFAFIYWLHYELNGAPTQLMELKADQAQITQLKNAAEKKLESVLEGEEDLKKLLSSAPKVELGKSVYIARCAVCHGDHLQGNIGPNLVDKFWIHGKGQLIDILSVVRKGVLEKGMPSWETMLKPEEIVATVVFIGANRGTAPANPKAPQGVEVVDDQP